MINYDYQLWQPYYDIMFTNFTTKFPFHAVIASWIIDCRNFISTSNQCNGAELNKMNQNSALKNKFPFEHKPITDQLLQSFNAFN